MNHLFDFCYFTVMCIYSCKYVFYNLYIFLDAEEGVRKVSAAISGQGVYGELKYEGGIHRVQRVPKTESKGRIHTSTISVAILPQPKEVNIFLFTLKRCVKQTISCDVLKNSVCEFLLPLKR